MFAIWQGGAEKFQLWQATAEPGGDLMNGMLAALPAQPTILMAPVRDLTGAYITVAGLSTITYTVYDLSSDTPGTPISGPTGITPISSVVLDVPQVDPVRWKLDETGYNFIHTLPSTAFPTADHHYAVSYLFTPTGGATARFALVLPVRTSIFGGILI